MREVSDRRQQLLRSLHRQRLESTGKLVASVAHDLRAPLAGIVHHAELLAQCRSDLTHDEASESMRDIRHACRLLQRTIDGLLDYARIGPQVDINLSLREILSQVASFVRPLLRDGRHEMRWEVRPGAEWVRGNPIVIQQALVNLIVNAVEAKREPCRIAVLAEDSRDASGGVNLFVRDDGPGIPDSVNERVFEAFFTTKARGTGLGLTVSREAMRDLGGDLQVVPSATGACFLMLLPCGETCESSAEGSS
jgi:signal transduction histidine kinase